MGNDGVLFFETWDAEGRRIAAHGDIDNFPVDFKNRAKENFILGEYRNAFRSNGDVSVRLILNKDHRLFQGSKAIERACDIYMTFAPKLQNMARSERRYSEMILKRFAHNLIALQTRAKDNFNRLISDAVRGRPYGRLHEEVKKRIEDDINSAARDVVQMAYRGTDLDAQIETLRIISGIADSSAPEMTLLTNLQRAMYRLTNPFVEEMAKNNIEFDIQIPVPVSDTEKVAIKHGAFNAAMWQLLDNTSKYAMPGSPIKITANLVPGEQRLMLRMTSVCIEPDEYDSIFQERYKGKNSGKKGGYGIGMFIVRKALSLMSARINVVNLGFVREDGGYRYCDHLFTISFPPRK